MFVPFNILTSKNKKFFVCKVLLCNILNIEKMRIETAQNKLIENLNLNDNKGKHDNHLIKLTNELKVLIQTHCKESLPHSGSHYTRQHTKLNCL